MLYTGKVVLKGILRDDILTHFMSLSVAMCILVAPRLVHLHSQYAHSLLVYFVRQGRELYGPEFLVYNVHSLLHITDDAVEFGGVDSCGGFAFENYLQSMKRMVRCGRNPLTQVVKRIHELDSIPTVSAPATSKSISVSRPNNTFVVNDDSCCEVVAGSNDKDDDGSNKFLCRVYNMTEPAFVKPCDSRLIGVYKTNSEHSRLKLLSRSCLDRRAIMTKKANGKEAVFMTILHEL